MTVTTQGPFCTLRLPAVLAHGLNGPEQAGQGGPIR